MSKNQNNINFVNPFTETLKTLNFPENIIKTISMENQSISFKKILFSVVTVFLFTPLFAQWVPHNNAVLTGKPMMIQYLQNTLYIGMENVLYSTSDEGVTWNTMIPWIPVSAIARNNSVIIVSATQSQMMRSTNDGSNWTDISSSIPTGVLIQSICFNGTVLMMSTYENGAYRSDDNGDSWSTASTGLPTNPSGTTYKTLYTLINLDASIIVGTGNGIYKTDNNGDTWILSSNGLPI